MLAAVIRTSRSVLPSFRQSLHAPLQVDVTIYTGATQDNAASRRRKYRQVIDFVQSRPDQYEPGFETTFQRLIQKLDPRSTDRRLAYPKKLAGHQIVLLATVRSPANTCHSSCSPPFAIAGIPLSYGERPLRRVPFGLGSSFVHHGPSCRRALFSSRLDACAATSRETQAGKRLSSTTCFPEAVCTSRICARCECGNRSESLTSAGHRRRCT